MREKELRLAIVLTGGVSLAVYMYGVARELLKLVRASKTYHSTPDFEIRRNSTYADLNDDPSRETDTEEIYFELLRELASDTELRVIIDVISGASAGGVNGVMLARAIAHDLPLDTHRTMWLEHADVLELMDEKTKAGRWSKFYLEPFFRGPFGNYFKSLAPEDETREKLFTFLKSRWFSPPFSGERFSNWMLDAAEKMEVGRPTRSSLMPDGHELDLFVSVTDFQGHNRIVKLHDPATAVETEHRLRLRFNYIKHPNGEIHSDFDKPMVPSLVFAARATSSFPGMFPAMTISEIDNLLEKRHQTWEGREQFLKSNFIPLYRGGRDPETAFFIDGSTVNDKPFAKAIAALRGRPAHREVVRRLLFIDPEADVGETSPPTSAPNMFRTLLGALMEIPRNEPVRDELERLNKTNRKLSLLRNVVELSRPRISTAVSKIISRKFNNSTVDQIAEWRKIAHEKTAGEAGIAYDSYFHLKLLRVLSRIEQLILDFADEEMEECARPEINQALMNWAQKNLEAINKGGSLPHQKDIDFLKSYDIDFYIRRLRFVIQKLNEFYRYPPDGQNSKADFRRLDRIKNEFYQKLAYAMQFWNTEFYSQAIRKKAIHVVKSKDPKSLELFLSSLKKYINLRELDKSADEIFARLTTNKTGANTLRELFTAYIGFSFFDLLSYPLVQQEDLTELEEVLIHRISPKDAKTLYIDGTPLNLKGRSLRNFGGFFNRSFREHDYLIGRLTAADRLIDMVLDVEPGLAEKQGIDIQPLKNRLFRKILETETDHLTRVSEFTKDLKEKLTS